MKVDMHQMFEKMGQKVREMVGESLGELRSSLDLLSGRLDSLESREPLAGKDGRDGVDGKDGAPGVEGKDGAPGVDGKDGQDGRDGRDGKDGRDGLDALDLTVLPAIDEGKSYSRGTWASHKGGLWVARRSTQGMEGWECVVSGVASIEAGFKTDRDFEVLITMSDGSHSRTGKHLPVMLDRGVYRPGMDAKEGDCVSFGGSLWVAQRDTQDKPGTDDSGWRLAVKKGRDGKDGTNGRDGLNGLNGKDWKGDRVE